MFNLFSIINNKYFKFIFIIINIFILLFLIYRIGFNNGKLFIQEKLIQQNKLNQEIYNKELNYKQKLVNDLTYNLIIESSINDNKYKELSEKLLKVNNNLSKCKLDADSLRYTLQSTRNMPSYSNTNSSNDEKTSHSNSISESAIKDFNCRDLSQSYLLSNKMYFQCKTIVDAWQKWYLINFKK